MLSKIALKRLSTDDLLFFKSRSSVQKRLAGGIDLDGRLFEQFYPSLPEIVENRNGQTMLMLNLYGPGLAPAYNLSRKIQKQVSYKSYRLNGELIADPEDDPERFRQLQPGDFVIFDFIGALEPYSATAVFIASALEVDAPFHSALDAFIGDKRMIELHLQDLEHLLAKVSLPEQHPANLLILEANLEDAALGGIIGIRALDSGPYLGKRSRQALERARRNAQKIGNLGEELLIIYLQELKDSGGICDFCWDADENAISPYDFSVVELNGSTTLIDAKSTRGNFNNRIHISYNELLQMRETEQYDLYRVYEITTDSIKIRIAEGMGKFAEKIITVFQGLPAGVKPDSVSVNVSELHFGREIEVEIPEIQD